MSKLHLTSPEERFEDLLDKITFLFITLSAKKSNFWREIFHRYVKNAIWVSRGTIWRETNFWRNICSFWSKCLKKLKFYIFSYLDRKNFQLLGKNTSSGLSKRPSTCPGERVEAFFRKKTDSFFYRSQTFSNNNLDFWQRNFSRVAKIEFYISKGTFCGFSSVKTLNNFYSFQTVSKKHSHFLQKFPAGLTKLPSTTPRDCLQVLFWEIYMLFITLALWEKTNPVLAESLR